MDNLILELGNRAYRSDLPFREIISILLPSLELAFVFIKSLYSETQSTTNVQDTSTLYIECIGSYKSIECIGSYKSCWIKWEKDSENNPFLYPRVSLVIEAKEVSILRRKSHFFHQSMSLVLNTIDRFKP